MNKYSFKELEDIIEENSFIAIDYILQALSMCKKANTHKFMVLLSVAILTHLDKPIPSNPVNGLFDQNFSHQERRFIAICLLRLLSLNSYYFEHEDDFRVKVFSLFDDVLSRDLYDKLGITQRLQTYVKSMKLKDAASIAELKMRENLDSLINFDRLDDYQGQFMKTINNSLVRAIIIPFLPRPLLYKARVSDLFDAIREYRQSSGSNIMEAYERASHITEQYLLEAQKYRTFYCKHYLSAIAERIIELLKKDFINSDVGQPAELVVNPLDKKYPFKQKDHALEIGFVIENRGTGHAFEVELSVYSLFDNIEFYRSTMHLGHLEPGSLIADFPAHVISSEEIALVEVTMNWHNADGSDKQVKVEYELKGQRTDIPWNDLVYEDPYSLEPVENYDDLIGRREKIDQLMRQCYAKSVGSSYIFGQKRVGKTSIAKALKSKLNQQDGFYPIYLEGGEYVHPDPKVTLSQLGVKLCENIKEYDKRLADLSIPKFEGALSPLTDFLKNVHELIPDLHILFILDEFDELPIDLYKRGSLADAFFLTLRTISGKPPFGIILIGGEKMEFIMSIQGDALNKFQAISVDYFDREKHWTDFQDLVRKPTIKWVEISDEAIVDLYKQTDGNPFYTMFVCKELFAMMVDRRDCHLTKREMKQAVQIALQKIRSNGFQHFWEDGVFEFTGDRVEEISIRRRRILIALANVLREKSKASKDDIEAQDVVYADVDFLESELRRFVQRGVLIQENNLYDCKVPFFRDWLKNY